jgi:5-methylcytosine-specific restriction endonuclease McrA
MSKQISLRLPEQDKRKSAAKLKEQYDKKLTCIIDGCNHAISKHDGPGSGKLCREHQLQQREYGGPGRVDRPWTFSRDWTCTWCGYNPKEDPWFENPPIPFENEVHKNQVMRSTLIADHLVRKVDGGGHGKDNVQTLCQTCNSKKTALFKDFVKTSKEVEVQ